MLKKFLMVLALILVTCAPCMAQETDLKVNSWGLRLGVASDPDQLVGGAQWNLGEVARNLRFVPNFEVGVGDDATLVMVNTPVHYVFRDAQAAVTPYLGGGLTLGWIELDRGRRETSDFEIALEGVAGVEWMLRDGNRFFLELNLVFGDFHDAQLLAGWSF